MGFDGLKGVIAEKADDAADVAQMLGAKAVDVASKGLRAAGKAAHQAQHDIRRAYYNPVFPDDYESPSFDLPNMIVIVDEDDRKGIDVCEGAIGWLSKEGSLEVLHLYQEFVPACGLDFFPTANCCAVYYRDALNDYRFIDLSSYYDVIQKDKLTELRNVAHALGATECRLELFEVDKTIKLKKGEGRVKPKARGKGIPKGSLGASAELSLDDASSRERRVLFEQAFEGSASPVRPELHWYRNDAELLSLISMRCDNEADNAIKDYTVTIDCSTTATMATSMAAKVDVALKKLGAVCNFSMEGESRKETRSRLVFKVVF